jgi:transposase-like protein
MRRTVPIEKVRKLSDSGLCAKEIADKLGFNPHTIHRIGREHGFVVARSTVVSFTKESLDNEYRRYKTVHEIARRHNVSNATILRHMKILGIKSNRKLVSFTEEELQREYSQTRSSLKISRKFGVSKITVLRWMRKFGIGRKVRVAPVEQVRELSLKGLSASEIAAEIGFTANYICELGRRENILIPDKFHPGYAFKHKYIMVRKPDHPFADCKGYVMAHRLVMETKLGRYLTPDEVVHHINGITTDNRPENLQVMDRSSHSKIPKFRSH